jgi:LCP family protein required for cell wall assembly
MAKVNDSTDNLNTEVKDVDMDDEFYIDYDGTESPAHSHHDTDSGPEGTETHHHHHHHHRHHTHGIKKTILIIVLVIAVIVAVAVVAWRALDYMGKTSLYNKANAAAPDISAAITEAAAASSSGEADIPAKTENWKAGWVRYNGKVYEYNSNILTFLFMGIDRDTKVKAGKNGIDGGQADGLFLLVLNPDTKKISIVAINRNTMTDIDVYDENGNYIGSGKGQICLQHGYGDGLEQSCERTSKAVSNLFYGLPVHGYCSINMGAVPTLVDEVGGITVPRITYKNEKISYGDDQTLNGSEAYQYIRYRGDEFNSASFRLEKQKEFLKAYVSKVKKKVTSDPATAIDLYNAIMPYMVTSIDTSEVTYLADNISGYTFNTDDIYSLKGTTAIGKTEHEEFTYDNDSLLELMISVFYKEVPEAETSGNAVSAG